MTSLLQQLFQVFPGKKSSPPVPAHRRAQRTATPSRSFTDLLAKHPHLSESQLLNANNRRPFSPRADVVVGGGGINGLIYAIHLKKIMPHLDIAVFEKSASPQYKIGESTLSSFTRWLNTDVAGSEYLLRLFGVKDGLDFLWVDESGTRVVPQDVGNFDVSYQLDRRVSDLFLTMWAQQLGVQVYHGVGVDYDVELPEDGVSMSESKIREIRLNGACISSSLGYDTVSPTVEAQYVCDASGFACRLTSQVGQKELGDSWNTNSVWAYFKPLEYEPVAAEPDELVDWDYAATKHICFPEGWGWFIKLISWHKAPLANLMDMLQYVIELSLLQTPVEALPSTMKLSRLFGCPFEFITSIGWVIRDDAPPPPQPGRAAAEDAATMGDSEYRFKSIQKKYPVLDRLMTQRYEVLPGYYNGCTYFVRKQLSFKRPVVAGHKWFAVGNATGFTNPLISPGINVGLLGAVKAAEITSACLQAERQGGHKSATSHAMRVQNETRAEYQEYIHDYVMPRLDLMNKLWYNSFRDGRLFEEITICFWALGSNSRSYLSYYFSLDDFEWLVGCGNANFPLFCKEILPLIEGPCDGKAVCDDVVAQVRRICRRWLDEMVTKYPQPWASNQRHYDDQLVRVEGKKARTGGHFALLRCQNCKYWMPPNLPSCQICGHK